MEKIYVVMLAEFWRGAENTIPLDAFRKEEDAIKFLKEEKENFENRNREYLNNYPKDFKFTNNNTHYKCEDIISGDNFELCVTEMNLN